MSEDLIKRSDAIEAVMNTEPVFAVDSLEPYQKTKDVVEALEAVPSADRPQGEWIDRSDGGRILNPWWETYECSKCGQYGTRIWNFCPNCGADMRGGKTK